MMNWSIIRDHINIAGSVASITGISLLWLNQFSPNIDLIVVIPLLVLFAVAGVGCIALAIGLFRYGFDALVVESASIWKIVYSCFAVAVLGLLVWAALYFLVRFGVVIVHDATVPRIRLEDL